MDRNGTVSKHQGFESDSDIAAQVKQLGVSGKDIDTSFEIMNENGGTMPAICTKHSQFQVP